MAQDWTTNWAQLGSDLTGLIDKGRWLVDLPGAAVTAAGNAVGDAIKPGVSTAASNVAGFFQNKGDEKTVKDTAILTHDKRDAKTPITYTVTGKDRETGEARTFEGLSPEDIQSRFPTLGKNYAGRLTRATAENERRLTTGGAIQVETEREGRADQRQKEAELRAEQREKERAEQERKRREAEITLQHNLTKGREEAGREFEGTQRGLDRQHTTNENRDTRMHQKDLAEGEQAWRSGESALDRNQAWLIHKDAQGIQEGYLTLSQQKLELEKDQDRKDRLMLIYTMIGKGLDQMLGNFG
jgi:hypothetical protein